MQYEANPLDTFPKQLFHQLSRHLSKKYDYGHLFISEAVKENISAYLPITNGHVIHNAVPEKYVSPQLAVDHLRELKVEPPGYLIVIPGRLHPSKGHTFFLHAVQEFLRAQPPQALQVVFTGGGHLKGALLQLIEQYGLQQQVIITDFVKNELLLSYLALSDLVVIPSINEGFGNVAIEALMQGSTVLASNTGGLPEIITDGENGFLFEKEDAADLRKKLKEIVHSKVQLPAQLLQADYQKRFTLKAQVEQLLKILGK